MPVQKVADWVHFETDQLMGTDNAELADWINKNLDYDQLILEFYTPVNLIADGYIAAIHLTNQENNFYMPISQRVKLSTNL